MFLVLYKYDNWIYAEVMKLVDVLDSKSCVGNHVPVRVRPSANKKNSIMEFFLFEYINLLVVLNLKKRIYLCWMFNTFTFCILLSGLVITDGAIFSGNWLCVRVWGGGNNQTMCYFTITVEMFFVNLLYERVLRLWNIKLYISQNGRKRRFCGYFLF